MDGLNRLFGGDRGSLYVLILLFRQGYSLDQILLAVLADGSVSDDWALLEEDGTYVLPERVPSLSLFDDTDEWEDINAWEWEPSDEDTPEAVEEPEADEPVVVSDTSQPLEAPAGDSVWSGSVHQVTPDTDQLQMFAEELGSGFCLDYSEPLDGCQDDGKICPRSSWTACTDEPRFEIIHDLGAGTISGWIDLGLECPGVDRWCNDLDRVSGTVTGRFGPFSYGERPESPPEEWPFPEHHWYPVTGDWWAGGPIELEVWISGDHYILDTPYTTNVMTTITGWVESRLGPTSLKPGELPTNWLTNFRITVESVDTVKPRWEFGLYFDWQFDETGVDIPPWRK